MGMIGGQELLIILAIVIILFGAKKIPELAAGLGKGIKEFKKATKDTKEEIENAPTVAKKEVKEVEEKKG